MTERVGLLGWPVTHSVSPAMHNAAFQALGLDWRYDLLPVPPDQFAEEVARLLATGYRGFNVTIPHKAAALNLPQVSRVAPAARAIGAVNTLVVQQDGSLHADNTDWQGFADDLRAQGIAVQGATCLVLGTGGSARAVVYALAHLGAARITLVSRSGVSGQTVTGWPVASYADLALLAPAADLIVNCTPVGMFPHVHESPWPEDVPFPPRAALYDLVYNPPFTALMRQAQAAGARAFGGLGMLVRQGALAFAQWVGIAPPLAIMAEAAQTALAGLHSNP
ncbi:MAG: shikimate dehydrogenase [Chloroflexota bacterium]